jgi:hypothetical protein
MFQCVSDRWRMMAVLLTVTAVLAGAPSSALAVRRLLAYAKGSHVWVSQPDGADAKRLGPAGDQVVLSPDARYVATIREAPRSNVPFYVSVYPTGGGAAENYRTAEFQPTVELAGILGFSPDSRYLAFRTATDVMVVDTRTGAFVATLPDASAASWAPKLPDRLAYTGLTASALSIWQPDGITREIVATGAYDPAWGPSTIAFARNRQIWTVRPNGSGLKRVTNVHGGAGPTAFTGFEPNFWSPTGRELVAFYEEYTTGHFCLVSLITGKQTPIVVLRNYADPVGFNASGTRLLIGFGPANYSPPGYADQIATMTLSGASIHTLVRDAGEPSWNL